ncbi:unnamed protein product [Phytophthora lilii]|uniref:Unnamed protein product n=1 Tax=Phytophthora lilii TaxID=2077276 RepID=A0A9W6TC56_9STRA|nr:unnamed protein product [Phytophthora lilii]
MDRKRAREVDADTAARPSKQAARAAETAADLAVVGAELASINELLQQEETSQKRRWPRFSAGFTLSTCFNKVNPRFAAFTAPETWQIGKRVKKLLESHEALPVAKQLDAYFLWGTALARLASLNEDPTLADAAADKFQQMLKLSADQQDEDAADAALGPVGFSLWGSSLLIVATETQSRAVLDQALAKFQRAVQVDGGTTFETRFQFAKALKEGGDLVAFLEQDGQAKRDYYCRALEVCSKLEEIYKEESAKEQSGEKEAEKEADSDEEEEDDDDDDKVTAEDFAEAKLLEAVLQGLMEEANSVEHFRRTLALYEEAIGTSYNTAVYVNIVLTSMRSSAALNPGSAEALMEKTNYLAARCLARTDLGKIPTQDEWTRMFDYLEAQYKSLLADASFDLQECHAICHRKDTHDQEEPEEEEIDERVPHLLNTLGKGLAAFVRAFPEVECEPSQQKKKQKQKQKQKRKKLTGGARFTHAVEVLRSAHHFHDKLGGYYLACLYASPVFEDEEKYLILAYLFPGFLHNTLLSQYLKFQPLLNALSVFQVDCRKVIYSVAYPAFSFIATAAARSRMSFPDNATDSDGYEWICSMLSDYSRDLLEFELDIDGQHFFDNMNHLFADPLHSTPEPDVHSCPVQLTPFSSEVSDTQDALPQKKQLSFSSRGLPRENAYSALNTVELRSRSFLRASSTPRNRRAGGLERRQLTVTHDAVSSSGQNCPAISRLQVNRRLF